MSETRSTTPQAASLGCPFAASAVVPVGETHHAEIPVVSTEYGKATSDANSNPAEKTLEGLTQRIAELEARLERAPDPNRLNMLVFEGTRDRLLAAFVVATGSAACGMEVTMFFTFWGISALRKPGASGQNKTLVERAFGWMLPKGLASTKLSHLDMCGMGRLLISREMKKKNIADLNSLLETAADLGVKIQVCEMSMQLMGIQRCELIDYPHLTFCGAASFADQASSSNTTLFI